MPKFINRRNFLKSSAVLAAAAGANNTLLAGNNSSGKNQEYYEIRVYRTRDANKQKMVGSYLENAFIPALNRMSINRIGVFTDMNNSDDNSIYVLIPYSTFDTFTSLNSKLQADRKYLSASEEHFAALQDDPVFTRIQSRFYKALEGIPVIEMPSQSSGNKSRIFELRIYESHTEEKAALKVDMFNNGEIQVMRDTELGPVFFGEALIGDDLPNLTYMLSASDMEAHEAHWSKFRDHPEWIRMKQMPKYADTVSHITNYFLIPTEYSQI